MMRLARPVSRLSNNGNCLTTANNLSAKPAGRRSTLTSFDNLKRDNYSNTTLARYSTLLYSTSRPATAPQDSAHRRDDVRDKGHRSRLPVTSSSLSPWSSIYTTARLCVDPWPMKLLREGPAQSSLWHTPRRIIHSHDRSNQSALGER